MKTFLALSLTLFFNFFLINLSIPSMALAQHQHFERQLPRMPQPMPEHHRIPAPGWNRGGWIPPVTILPPAYGVFYAPGYCPYPGYPSCTMLPVTYFCDAWGRQVYQQCTTCGNCPVAGYTGVMCR